ncbi:MULTISPECIES: phage tail protein [Enterobacter]|uniref:phage tail protein n=1 Tax=Enterobacter TaxID=547 RepID=UPI0018690410|nr:MULTISPECIES: phage tail protein [Enterobacter]MBE3210832.1 phage tail protein [Enterobacter cloacae complex sp. P32C]MCM7429775.1 phage tail protein [Enterobacter bugandensis]
MAEKYYSILTNRGKELEAQSSATGKPVIIKDFVVGDGNGQPVTPNPALTALIHEVYRSGISALQVSPDQANQFIAQLVLPPGVGGFVVREVGLLTDAGELYAVANCAAIEKPVSGISVTLQFRLAVSETADIELKVATGDGLFLRQDANLRDVKDASESRKNIGLKGAAVLDVGTTANTVAAGDDHRIVNALQKENNLSDVQDKALAREHLELRAAAVRDVADNAAGALVPVGYKGNFSSDSNHGAIDFATYPFVVGESLFIDTRGCTNTPPFLTQDFYYIDVVCATGPAQGGRVNRPLVQFVSYTNSKLILAIREDDGNNIGWRYFRAVQYDNDNNTVTIPGALKAVNGGAELSQNAINIRGAGNKHLWFFNASGSEMGLVYASDDKVLHLRAAQGPSVDIQSNGNVIAPNYLEAKDDIHSGRNISSVGLIQAGAGLYDTPGVRVYSPNNPPPQQDLSPYARRDSITTVGLSSNNPAYPYMRQESTGAIINLAPQDWVSGNFATNAWTSSNFLQGGVRLASPGTADNGNNDGNFAYAPDGAVVTAVMQKTNYTAVQFRYIQYNINGNWYTAWVS